MQPIPTLKHPQKFGINNNPRSSPASDFCVVTMLANAWGQHANELVHEKQQECVGKMFISERWGKQPAYQSSSVCTGPHCESTPCWSMCLSLSLYRLVFLNEGPTMHSKVKLCSVFTWSYYRKFMCLCLSGVMIYSPAWTCCLRFHTPNWGARMQATGLLTYPG